MFDLDLISHYPLEIIATDEVGRGPLCGPVVIGAIRLLVENSKQLKTFLDVLVPCGVTDSKKLTAKKRLAILEKLGIHDLSFEKIHEHQLDGIKFSYVTWQMDHEVIDRENILAASLRGMKEAVLSLSEFKDERSLILIDGNKTFRWVDQKPNWKELAIVKGDSKSLLIGLASIIAKEKRDHFMNQMHELYPEYGMNQHAGYGTKSHLEAIRLHGPSPIHRKTFKGVKEYV